MSHLLRALLCCLLILCIPSFALGISLVPIPPSTSLPMDPDADGRYEDLNGNGRLDFNDVVLFFNQMDWITANEPLEAFDFNGNSMIDFSDIVTLFNNIGDEPAPAPTPATSVLISQTVSPSDQAQTIRYNNSIAVTIPGGELSSPALLHISTVTNPPSPPEPGEQTLTMLEVSIGDRHTFDSEIQIEAPYDPALLPAGTNTAASVRGQYWDPTNSSWVLVPILVDTDRHVVLIGTKHLTLFKASKKAEVVPVVTTAHFTIYYDTDDDAFARFFDSYKTFPNAHGMAEQCGNALEIAYSTYTARGFQPPHPSLGGDGKVIVTIGRYAESFWSTWTGRIYISVYPDTNSPNEIVGLYHELSHELFHAVQNQYSTVFGMDHERWWTEATAEYAANTVPGAMIEQKPIPADYFSKPIDYDPNIGDRHKYGTSRFIPYLIQSSFSDLWNYTVSRYDVYDSLDSYLKTQGSSLTLAYLGFVNSECELLLTQAINESVDSLPVGTTPLIHDFKLGPHGTAEIWVCKVKSSGDTKRMVAVTSADGSLQDGVQFNVGEWEAYRYNYNSWNSTWDGKNPYLFTNTESNNCMAVVTAVNVADSTRTFPVSIGELSSTAEPDILKGPLNKVLEGKVVISFPNGVRTLHLTCIRYGGEYGFDRELTCKDMVLSVTGDSVEVPVYVRTDIPPQWPSTRGPYLTVYTEIPNPPENDILVCTSNVEVEITRPEATGTVSGSILP